MPGGEQFHIDGQDGVDLAKRWLEATGRFTVQWHSGQKVAVPYLAVDQLDGSKEGFDIRATHLNLDSSPRAEIYAEVKNYNGAHKQPDHYKKFLTDCASAVLVWQQHPPVPPTEFMWITWHPFGATKDYLLHVASETVKAACQTEFPKPGAPDQKELRIPAEMVTDDLCDDVARRLWFIIAPRRLEEMLIDPKMLARG
jgi:hypothetical protein